MMKFLFKFSFSIFEKKIFIQIITKTLTSFVNNLTTVFTPGHHYRCTKCGRGYVHKGDLSRHTRYECGLPPTFSCSVCGKMFRIKTSWTRHMATVHASLILSNAREVMDAQVSHFLGFQNIYVKNVVAVMPVFMCNNIFEL